MRAILQLVAPLQMVLCFADAHRKAVALALELTDRQQVRAASSRRIGQRADMREAAYDKPGKLALESPDLDPQSALCSTLGANLRHGPAILVENCRILRALGMPLGCLLAVSMGGNH